MTLIKRSDTSNLAQNAIKLDLGNLEAEGDLILKRAREDARQIIEKAKVQSKVLLQKAENIGWKEGFEQGVQEGRDQGLEQGRREIKEDLGVRTEELAKSWNTVMLEFEKERLDLIDDAKTDILRLATEIAMRVTRVQICHKPESIEQQLEEILNVVLQPTKLQISINPEDEPIVSEFLPNLQHLVEISTEIEIHTDPNLSRGSCKARSGKQGLIDASLDTKLSRLVQSLLPEQ